VDQTRREDADSYPRQKYSFFSSFTDTDHVRVKKWNGQSARRQWMRRERWIQTDLPPPGIFILH
jgi:hypothetical protein